MKRAGNLYESIADMDNLRLAFIKAKRGKEASPDVFDYSLEVEKRLLNLRKSILEEKIKLGEYRFFTIYEPKERLICAAPFGDRILHHAIINVCHPVFERFQISDSYATRIGKGQYAALERAGVFQSAFPWFCKLDIRKYFDSIDHVILLNLLSKRFKDKRLLSLFTDLIDSYQVLPGKGLPIGNLTSQYFANFFLAHADHYIKENIRVPGYVRYMDDMVFWGSEKSELIHWRNNFISFLNDQLHLGVKPDCLNRSGTGLPFLGYVLFENTIRLNKHSKQRFFRKMSTYDALLNSGKWQQKEFGDHVLPLVAFTRYASAHELRLNHMNRMETGQRAPTV